MPETNKNRLIAIAEAFDGVEGVINVSQYGMGHINDTYLVETKGKEKYILQRINQYVLATLKDQDDFLDQGTMEEGRTNISHRYIIDPITKMAHEIVYGLVQKQGHETIYDFRKVTHINIILKMICKVK